MKIEILLPSEVEVTANRCILPVNFGEEDMPNDFPFRRGNTWDITIDLDTKKIRDWPVGRFDGIYKLSMKVCDGGTYHLLGQGGEEVVSVSGDYVPRCLPQDCGDYFDCEIDRDGTLLGWRPTEDAVASAFFAGSED